MNQYCESGPSFVGMTVHEGGNTISISDLHATYTTSIVDTVVIRHHSPINTLSISSFPFFLAHAKGVEHAAPDFFGSAPCFNKYFTISVCPHFAANPNGVERYSSSIALISAPC